MRKVLSYSTRLTDPSSGVESAPSKTSESDHRDQERELDEQDSSCVDDLGKRRTVTKSSSHAVAKKYHGPLVTKA